MNVDFGGCDLRRVAVSGVGAWATSRVVDPLPLVGKTLVIPA